MGQLARDMPRAQVKFGLYCTLLSPHISCVVFPAMRGWMFPTRQKMQNVCSSNGKRPATQGLVVRSNMQITGRALRHARGSGTPFPRNIKCTPMNWSCAQIKTHYLARTLGLLLNACKLVVPVSSHRPGVAVRSSAARPTRPAKVPFPLIQYVVHVDQQTHVRRETHLLVPSLQSQ